MGMSQTISAPNAGSSLAPKPTMTLDEALVEAHRCLMCWDAPCIKACPTDIDVPQFIKRIANNDLVGSARTILDANILGASCARGCPTEMLCAGACVLNDLHERPIDIGRLQAFATDDVVFGDVKIFPKVEPTGNTVAVVGAGPAGLSCAAELAKLGHEVVVYDANEQPGGLNTYGVASYKMDIPTSLAEVEFMQRAGTRIWHAINQRWPEIERITVFAGQGNNGGDAFVIALAAKSQAIEVQLICQGDLSRQSPASTTYSELWQRDGGEIQPWSEQENVGELIVDGLLGIGLDRELDREWQQLIDEQSK